MKRWDNYKIKIKLEEKDVWIFMANSVDAVL